MKKKSELVKFLQKQIRTENQISDLSKVVLREIGNPAIRGVLKGISLESSKHAEMYNSTVALLVGASGVIGQENFDRQRSFLEKHIELESELISELVEVMPSVENGQVRLLLNSILMDKKRHLELLRQILEVTDIGETIQEGHWEDIWWDMMWKDSRGSS